MCGTGAGYTPDAATAALRGTFDINQEVAQQEPDDWVDGEWTASPPARMVALPISLWFDEAGAHAQMEAWLYGLEDGSLLRTSEIATWGDP